MYRGKKEKEKIVLKHEQNKFNSQLTDPVGRFTVNAFFLNLRVALSFVKALVHKALRICSTNYICNL